MPDMAVRTQFTAVDRVSATFGRMGAAADKFSRRGSAIFARLNKASDSFLGGIKGYLPVLGAAGVLKFANSSIEAWHEQETAVANLEAGLKSTNNAIGTTSKQFQNMASDWQKIGIFGDEAILQNVTTQLLTFGSVTKKNFNEMQGAAMDITAKLYGVKASSEQLQGVTIMLGKAMDDPARGMTALRRRGIQFTEQQENMIKVMQRTEGREKAQAYLLKEINKLYGGTNVALRKTAAGMEIGAKNEIGDAMELVGEQLVPLKKSLLEFVLKILPPFTKALPPILKIITKLAPLLPYIVMSIAGLKVVFTIAKGFFLFSKGLRSVIAFTQLWKAFGLLETLKTYPGTISNVVSAIQKWEFAQKALNIATKAMPWFALIAAITFLATELPGIIANWDQWTQSQVNTMGTLGAVIGMLKALSEAWDTFKTKGFLEGMGKLTYEVNKKTFRELQTKTGVDATPDFLKKYAPANEKNTQYQAPNKAEAEIRNNNNVRVNLYNANPGSKAEVSPRRGARVNMEMAGAN